MKKIEVNFKKDISLNHINVLVSASELDKEVEALMERVSERPPDILEIKDVNGQLLKINMYDIIFVSVTQKLSQIVTENEKYTFRQSLQSIEDLLNIQMFVRISRYELINLNKVKFYDLSISGTLRLELAGGAETWVSRRFVPVVRKRLITGGGKEF